MSDSCVFCRIVSRAEPASIVYEDDLTIAVIDLRQFNPGHTLVMPREHLHDVRDLDDRTGAAVMATVTRAARAVGEVFPNQGLSIWHSIGEAADQEVPHLHVHIHPRLLRDGLLRVYPSAPDLPVPHVRDRYAVMLRDHIAKARGADLTFVGADRDTSC